jgi:hypothetical protein
MSLIITPPPRWGDAEGAPSGTLLSESDIAIARCRQELAEIERLLKAGHPDLEGLVRALVDWSGELRLLTTRRQGETA